MSTAPSSIPPPSFDVAPELPEGVERPPPPGGPRWKPWMAWVGARRRLRRRAHGRAHRRASSAAAAGASFADPTPGGEHLGDDRAGPVVHRRRAALRAASPGRAAARAVRPAPDAPLAGRGLDGASPSSPSTSFTLVVGGDPGRRPRRPKLPDELGVKDSTVALLAVAFLVAVVAPIAEEFFFRGFFFTALRNWKGLWPAAIITGLVFGAIHVGSAEAAFLLPLAFFGFALCLLLRRAPARCIRASRCTA